MKQIQTYIWMIVILFIVTSCAKEEAVTREDASFEIQVVPDNFISMDAERSTRTVDEEYNTYFTNGDKIGIVAVDVATGTVHADSKNIPYRYEDAVKSWVADGGQELKYHDNSFYIVYYPYMEGIDWIFDNNAKTGYEACVKALYSHFSETKFNPAEQSTQEKYASMDLMVGKAQVMLDEKGQPKLSVRVNHQFALILVDMKQKLVFGGTKALVPYISDASGWSFKPFMASDSVCRVLIKPSKEQQFVIAYNRYALDEYLYQATVNLPPGKYIRYNIVLPARQ